MQERIVRPAIAVMAIALLAVSLVPGIARADDSSRISQLELEIQRLRTRVDEQQRRILRLEEELGRRVDSGTPVLPPPDHVSDSATGASAATRPQPWHAAKSWASVAKGMTEGEVREILGAPTSAEGVGAYKTMFYRGPVADAGFASGIVNLKDGRVVAVKPPDF